MQAITSISETPGYDLSMPAGRPSKRPRSSFGARLVQARQQAGLTQQQLAEKLGLSQHTIAHWERAEVALRADQLKALTELLNVTADFLIGNESAPKRNGGGPVGRARRVFEAVTRMPRHQQNKVIDVVEAFVLRGNQEG
jgi:transcriptional regulator with XRE-family HTH domain